MGEDEAPPPLPDHVLNDFGEDDGLPAPSGQNQEGAQIAYEYTLPKAIKDGFLCPIKAVTIPLQLDLSGVGVHGGGFS